MGPTEAAADHFCSLGFRAAFESSRENVADLLLDAISGAIRPSEQTAAPSDQQTPHGASQPLTPSPLSRGRGPRPHHRREGRRLGAARSPELAEEWREARADPAAPRDLGLGPAGVGPRAAGL